MLRDASGVHELGPGRGFLCSFPDADHLHWREAGGEPWEFVYIDWRGGEAMVEEIVGRRGQYFEMQAMPTAVERLLAWRDHDGEMVVIAPHEAAELVMGVLTAFLGASRDAPAGAPGRRLVRRARAMIHARAESDVNVAELARTLEVSPEHLCRVFREETGRTPRQALEDERLRCACRMLVESDVPSSEIAARLGYSTASNFARAFRRMMGISPAAFRERGEVW